MGRLHEITRLKALDTRRAESADVSLRTWNAEAAAHCSGGVVLPTRCVRIVRYGLLITLFAAELSHLGIPLLSNLNSSLRGWWWPIVASARPLAETMIGVVLVGVFLQWEAFRDELGDALREADYTRLNFWFGIHLLCVALDAIWLEWGMQNGTFTSIAAEVWFFVGVILLPFTAISWSFAVVPHFFWKRWLTRSPQTLALASVVGILTRWAGYFAQMLWPPLCHYTFRIVDLMLHALGVLVVSDPAHEVIGTARFAVAIAPTCSGLEGIALICIFLPAYLWFYRTEYHFPAALALIPAGIASIWILNAVRITALILIGQRFSYVAVTGFHSVAGWIFFNLTAFGMVIASRHMRWIICTDERYTCSGSFREPNPALPYLVPLLLTMGIAMLTASFANGFDGAYPLRVIVSGLAICWYRERIAAALLGLSLPSASLGVFCFLLWIVLSPPDRITDAAVAAHLNSLPTAIRAIWILFRVVGAIVTVAIAEELAFRGYLLRRLIKSDFDSALFNDFTWQSFIISSVAFGVLHQSWSAGILVGALFAIAMYYRGRLADAIAAHATANAVLAIYIIATGHWSLWN